MFLLSSPEQITPSLSIFWQKLGRGEEKGEWGRVCLQKVLPELYQQQTVVHFYNLLMNFKLTVIHSQCLRLHHMFSHGAAIHTERWVCGFIVGPRITQVWTVQVRLRLCCFPPTVGSLWMQGADCVHWSRLFYVGHVSICGSGAWNQSSVDT